MIDHLSRYLILTQLEQKFTSNPSYERRRGNKPEGIRWSVEPSCRVSQSWDPSSASLCIRVDMRENDGHMSTHHFSVNVAECNLLEIILQRLKVISRAIRSMSTAARATMRAVVSLHASKVPYPTRRQSILSFRRWNMFGRLLCCCDGFA